VFDIGITELIIVSAIGLIVLGPERLPLLFRTIGSLLGRAQAYVSDVKDDIQKQIELEELAKAKKSITSFSSEISDEISSLNGVISETSQTISKNINIKGTTETDKKFGFYMGSSVMTWPEENSYVRLRDRLRERTRQRFLKKRKLR
tara:strand:+ start:284 stop:724 length:441 start_codon:yes stop_codon:yes gene_type:complete